jgi:putative ATP-binding cassette transporter
VQVLTLFGRELSGGKWRTLLILAAVSGISSAAVLATINLSAGNIGDPDVMAHALVVLVLAIFLFVYSQKTLMVQAAELAQRTVHHLRLGLLETLQAAELLEVENLNRSEIFSTVSTEMRVISDGASTMMVVAQSAVLTVVTMAYLAWLSLVAFVLAAIFISIAASIHISRHRQIMDQHARMFALNNEMMDGFSDFVDGFKEVKLNAARAQELGNRVSAQSASVSARSLEFQSLFATSFVASQVTFFLLTGIMVFIVPVFTTIDPQTLVKITATTLFLIGPISAVVGGLPTVQRLNAAADLIMSLQRRLSEIQHWSPPGKAQITKFDRIELSDVTFSYASTDEDEAGFTVGPISMPIDQGKVIFITGGNGSGKSTLLKLVTSLYLPTAGKLILDGRTLGDDDIVPFRNLFTAIFSDNHLFREFYGIPEINPAKVTEYLQLLELEHKVSIKGRSFSTVALSSGQRKRLALLVALLENRPIYVFDEWAADQDPHFRRKFYQTILPSLKALGKTIFAVTHDERYFDTADIRFHMEEGQLRQVTGSSPPGEE